MEVSDDSGFLGLADFNSYDSFVAENWDFPLIRKHLEEQIGLKRLVFFSTGMGNTWKVRLSDEPTLRPAYREFRSTIEVTGERLYLCNFETLTMAAQFADVSLPEQHLDDLFIALDNGLYSVTCRQLFHPDQLDYESDADHFEFILQKPTYSKPVGVETADEIFWFDE